MLYTLYSKKNRGFTMVELVVTIAILSLGIMGAYSAFFPIVAISYNTSSRLIAAYLSQEGLEIVRNIRDNNFVSGAGWSNGLAGSVNCSLGCQADYRAGTAAGTAVNQLQDYNPANALLINSEGFYGYDTGTPSAFKRKIIITENGINTLRVSSQVTWEYGGQSYSFEAEESLYNWY